MKGISIIICCYNSALRLPETISHIARQKINNDLNWELIIVNNASKDNTGEVAKQLLKKYSNIPGEVVFQEIPGLMAAREKGMECAKYDTWLFCDDDNWIDENYVQNASNIIDNDENIAVLGGIGSPIFEQEPDFDFENYQNFYAVGKQFPQSGEVKGQRNVVYGAGMVVRKAAYQDILNHGFNPLTTGRKGKKLSAGEDSEMCLAMRIAGYKIWYDERLTFKHFIPADRCTLDYLKRAQKGMQNSGFYSRYYLYVVKGQEINFSRPFWIKEIYYALMSIFSFGKQDRKRSFRFIVFLLKMRTQYDNNIEYILNFKKSFE